MGFLSYLRLESERQYSGSSFGPLNPEGRRISGSYRKRAGLRFPIGQSADTRHQANRPETGYGYIQIAEAAGDNFYKVKTFTEKPELELAKVFVESGEFYWNSGLFMWNVNTIIKANEALLPELTSKLAPGKDVYGTVQEKQFIDENFPACPNVSIDFGIMEKADNVYVSLGDFGWSDLGTWGSLYDLSPKDEAGNVALKCKSLIYNSKDNIVVLPDNKLAVIDGLEGYLIAESDNVLLICKKDEEHTIRKYVNDAQIKLGEKYI